GLRRRRRGYQGHVGAPAPRRRAMADHKAVARGGSRRRGRVVMGLNQGVVAYNLRSRTVRQVVDADESGDDPLLLPSRYVFRESLVWHGFFEARRHPGLPSFRFCQ
uniref:Uncharacterized protein n=1 Tax=Aegilops tauschii subsp. strangulata TaxID=200361 RepID=A0A453ART1_AEGTS